MSQRDYLIVECDNGRTLNSPAMGRCGRCDADLEGLRVEPRSEWNQRRDAESAADPAETLAQDHVPAAFRDALRDALVEYGECAFPDTKRQQSR